MNKMSLQKSIQNFGIKQAFKDMEKDPEENISETDGIWLTNLHRTDGMRHREI